MPNRLQSLKVDWIDTVEERTINFNLGAESTFSYLPGGLSVEHVVLLNEAALYNKYRTKSGLLIKGAYVVKYFI